jgi:hypothetical protein
MAAVFAKDRAQLKHWAGWRRSRAASCATGRCSKRRGRGGTGCGWLGRSTESKRRLDVSTFVYNAVRMAETIRIDPVSHAFLAEIARAKHIPLTEALARAVAGYRLEVDIQAMDAAYAALQEDPVAWAEELAERAMWDNTNLDGLENE